MASSIPSTSTAWPPASAIAANPGRMGDFNYDGTVDTTDFNVLVANFAQTLSASSLLSPPLLRSSVLPDPSSPLITLTALIGSMVVCARPRRQQRRGFWQ